MVGFHILDISVLHLIFIIQIRNVFQRIFSIGLDITFNLGKPQGLNDCSSLQLSILEYVGFLRFCYCSPESLLRVGGVL